MKICFVLNDIETEGFGTSVIILRKAHKRGHEVYVMGAGDFIFYRDKGIYLRCKKIPKDIKYDTIDEFWAPVKHEDLKRETIDSKNIDVLFLRNNPTQETPGREWAEHCSISFAQMIKKNGVLVVNDPAGLSQAFIDKLYFEELPAEIKPNSIITRDKKEILKFWEKNNHQMVLKPLEGSRGQNVYKIGRKRRNINQILTTLTDQGYVIGQEYLSAISKGDVRVLMINGKILKQDGELAIIRRVNDDKREFRSNLTLGATPSRGKLTPEIKHIVAVVGPKLKQDGIFFAGLDIVADKLIEINVLSPGGMDSYKKTGMVDFTDSVVKALERKVAYKKERSTWSNRELATTDSPSTTN